MIASAQLAKVTVDTPKTLLESVAKQGKPLLFEIEQTLLRFRSRISIKEDKVIVSKPPALKGDLAQESHVRLRAPGQPPRDVRLKILVPHAEIERGSSVFICGMPDAFSQSARSGDRYSVLNNQNLVLEMNGQKFQLVDLSLTGFRVALKPAQTPLHFPLGKTQLGANLMLGVSVWVRMVKVIPRTNRDRTIGCEFKVASDDMSVHNLNALVDSLKRAPG